MTIYVLICFGFGYYELLVKFTLKTPYASFLKYGVLAQRIYYFDTQDLVQALYK